MPIVEPDEHLTLEEKIKEFQRLAEMERVESEKYCLFDVRNHEHNVLRMHYLRGIEELKK